MFSVDISESVALLGGNYSLKVVLKEYHILFILSLPSDLGFSSLTPFWGVVNYRVRIMEPIALGVHNSSFWIYQALILQPKCMYVHVCNFFYQ